MNTPRIPDWIDPSEWLPLSASNDQDEAAAAVHTDQPGIREFARMISPGADVHLEAMAQKALDMTRRHFGRTITLYAPLYLSDYCSAGCVYCGFSSDLEKPRRKLSLTESLAEILAMKKSGLQEVLLLTGDRTKEADHAYLCEHTAQAAAHIHNVNIEAFTMSEKEYQALDQAGCSGIALYQETYDPALYKDVHRWGPKVHYQNRIDAPAQALAAGMRNVGMGVLLGLHDPAKEIICLFRHITALRKTYWKSGLSLSFPRIRPQLGGFNPRHSVSEHFLAKIIFAFRLCFPEMTLTLSTRESPEFRDGMAGLGINKMSVASKTTVGGYAEDRSKDSGQFDISDERDIESFCSMLRTKGLEPVFKNWDAVYR
jgi:2-iminoacetate synthase